MAKVVAVAKKEALEMSQSKSNVLKLGLSSSWNCYGSVDYALSEKVDILILKSSKVHHLKCRLEPVNYQDILDIHLEYLTDFFWVYLVGMSGVTFCLVGEGGGETESETAVVVAVVVVLACGPS